MNWTAPDAAQGPIRFYAAVNAANGNNGTSGDKIYLTNFTVQPMVPAALLAVEPNTAAQGQSLVLTITGSNTSWIGTNPIVQLVSSTNPTQTIDAQSVNINTASQLQATFSIPANASPGIYHVKVNDLQLNDAFTITAVTSLADNNDKNFKIYPNPTNGDWMVIEHNLINPNIRIYNLGG